MAKGGDVRCCVVASGLFFGHRQVFEGDDNDVFVPVGVIVYYAGYQLLFFVVPYLFAYMLFPSHPYCIDSLTYVYALAFGVNEGVYDACGVFQNVTVFEYA